MKPQIYFPRKYTVKTAGLRGRMYSIYSYDHPWVEMLKVGDLLYVQGYTEEITYIEEDNRCLPPRFSTVMRIVTHKYDSVVDPWSPSNDIILEDTPAKYYYLSRFNFEE